MRLTQTNIKRKLLTAIAAVGLCAGISGVAHAAPVLIPYSQDFENPQTKKDQPKATYTIGANGSLGNQGGSVPNVGQPTDGGAAYSIAADPLNVFGQSLKVVSNGSGVESDTLLGNGGTTANALKIGPLEPASSPYHGVVKISFNAQLASPSPTGIGQSSFGIGVLSSDPNHPFAGAFLTPGVGTQGGADPGGNGHSEFLTEASGLGAQVVQDPHSGTPFTAGHQGSWGSYSITLNFNNDTFALNANGTQLGTYALDASAGSTINGISFTTFNEGSDTAYFDNISVVPEPAAISMVGVGTLMLLAKRPKRLA